MADDQDLRTAGDRIETLLAELAGEGRWVGARAEELVQLLLRLYGAGLDRILSAIDSEAAGNGAEDSAADRIFARLVEDDLVASLLVLHGLHPLDLDRRIARALDRVRPYLGSHGGDVELLGVEGGKEGVVRLRLLGSCKSCPSSSVTMRLAVERAIAEAAPEIVRIEVEGVVAEGAETAGDGAAQSSGLVQIGGGGIRGVRSEGQGQGRDGEAAPNRVSAEDRAWQAQPPTPLSSPS